MRSTAHRVCERTTLLEARELGWSCVRFFFSFTSFFCFFFSWIPFLVFAPLLLRDTIKSRTHHVHKKPIYLSIFTKHIRSSDILNIYPGKSRNSDQPLGHTAGSSPSSLLRFLPLKAVLSREDFCPRRPRRPSSEDPQKHQAAEFPNVTGTCLANDKNL